MPGRGRIRRSTPWRPGATAPPWATTAVRRSADQVIAAVVAANLARPVEPTFAGARVSAVLVAVADGPSGAELLLTRRTMNVSTHQGEVSFPGGRVEPGESIIEAALREAHEEVGLDPSAVEVVGELDHLSTRFTGNYIVPVVGKVTGPVELVPSAAEVARIMWVPVADLAAPDVFREEWWSMGEGEHPIYFFELPDETVWGATGRMVCQLLSVTFGAPGPSPASV